LPPTEKSSGKYLKKLAGRTDMEDALKNLDTLTNEEARMATAQVLKATRAVDVRVRGVGDKVLDVDNRVAGVDDKVEGVNKMVAGVDDRVASVDNRVEGVEGRVASVDDKVKAVDDKVAVVIDGAQSLSIGHLQNIFNSDVPRGKRGKGSRTTDGKRHGPSETFVIFPTVLTLVLGVQAQESSQGTKYDRTFSDGSLRRIRLLITTLLVVLTTRGRRSGFSKAVSSRDGNPRVRFCGFTENVRPLDLSNLT
jgi:archaellum component FlaC